MITYMIYLLRKIPKQNKTKQRSEKSGTVLSIQISLMLTVIEDSWDLLSASAFSMLQYTVLVEIYVENTCKNCRTLRYQELISF